MRVLLDTNMVIDALAGREPFNRLAEQIFMLCETGAISGYLSGNSITDIYYLLRRHLPEDTARRHIRHLVMLFGILPVGEAECSLALVSPVKDFEDAIQAACAECSGMDYIITRDSAFLEQCTIAIAPATLIAKVGF